MSSSKPTDMHKQCKLVQDDRVTHSWIPSRYAVRGKVVGLKDRETGEWEEGWTVEEVWGARRSIEVVSDAQNHKKHRDGTDARRSKGSNGKPGDLVMPRR